MGFATKPKKKLSVGGSQPGRSQATLHSNLQTEAVYIASHIPKGRVNRRRFTQEVLPSLSPSALPLQRPVPKTCEGCKPIAFYAQTHSFPPPPPKTNDQLRLSRASKWSYRRFEMELTQNVPRGTMTSSEEPLRSQTGTTQSPTR